MRHDVLNLGEVYKARSICLRGWPKSNKELFEIVTVFKKVCKDCNVDPSAVLTEEIVQEPTDLQNFLRSIAGDPNAQASVLPQIANLDFRSDAAERLDDYKKYLMDELERRGRETVKHVETQKVSNRFAMIYHILMRLAALALCNDVSANRDGTKLINVMYQFVSRIGVGSVLLSRNFYESDRTKPTPMARSLVKESEHGRLVKRINEIVKVMSLLNGNQANLNQVDRYLRYQIKTIQIYLLLELGDDTNPLYATDEQITTGFMRMEQKLLLKHPQLAKQSTLEFTDEGVSSYMARVEKIIAAAVDQQQKKVIDTPRVRQLYRYMMQGRYFWQLMDGIKREFTGSGWMSVIKSAFSFTAIKHAFAEYHTRVVEFLEQKDYEEHQLGAAVIKSRAKGFGLRIDDFLDKLGNFARPDHVRDVQQQLKDNQQELIRLQEMSKTVLKGYDVVRYDFVDEPRLREVGRAMELPNALGVLPESISPKTLQQGDGLTKRARRVCVHWRKVESYLAARKATGNASFSARLDSFYLIESSLLSKHMCTTRDQFISRLKQEAYQSTSNFAMFRVGSARYAELLKDFVADIKKYGIGMDDITQGYQHFAKTSDFVAMKPVDGRLVDRQLLPAC